MDLSFKGSSSTEVEVNRDEEGTVGMSLFSCSTEIKEHFFKGTNPTELLKRREIENCKLRQKRVLIPLSNQSPKLFP